MSKVFRMPASELEYLAITRLAAGRRFAYNQNVRLNYQNIA